MKTSTLNTPNPSPVSDSSGILLEIRHDTLYRYSQPASLGYNAGWLKPASHSTQDCQRHRLKVEPRPSFQREHEDVFGNTVTYFELVGSHEQCRVRSQALVRVTPKNYSVMGQHPWELACFAGLSQGPIRTEACRFAFPTGMTVANEEMKDYARVSFTPGRSLNEAAQELSSRIYHDFRYQSGVTDIDTPLDEVWEKRRGVCQDFAHLALAMLRSLGLACCYVSGYLLTHPPKGEKKRLGADASHAWFGVMDASGEWMFLDPTNDLWVQMEHIEVARGRDYCDVPPVKGMSYGGGEHSPDVAVTVEAVQEEE